MKKNKIKILYLDSLLSYINPSRNLIPNILSKAGVLYCYGPGYTASDELKRGCKAFSDKHGPFDIIISSIHITLTRFYPKENIENRLRHYARSFPNEDLLHFDDMFEFFLKFDGPKLALMLESDPYNFSAKQIDILNQINTYLIGWGINSIESKKNLRFIKEESFGQRINDNYFEFIRESRNRVVEFHHYVSEHELCWTPLAHRSTPWSILGAMYRARRIAIDTLKENGIRASKAHYGFPFELARRFRLLGPPTRTEQAIVNYAFRRKMQTARYGYTCGSALRYPIRKYFEIPAAGAVLVCDPCAGFEDLGFVDGENAIVCEPEGVHKVHHLLENEPERAQKIADRGRALVLDRHVVGARARQLRECLEAIVDGTFAGSRWNKGRFEVIRKKEHSPNIPTSAQASAGQIPH